MEKDNTMGKDSSMEKDNNIVGSQMNDQYKESDSINISEGAGTNKNGGRSVRGIVIAALAGIAVGCLGMWCIITSFGSYTPIDSSRYDKLVSMEEKYSKLEDLNKYIEDNYYQDVDEDSLKEGMYSGIFEGLDDPYSSYMTKDEYKKWDESLSGEFEGIGVYISQDEDGNIVILSCFKDSPAEKAGLQSGDIIMEVDGRSFKDADGASAAIRGKAGTKVKIKYYRKGKNKGTTDTVKINRAKVKVDSVTYEIDDDNIGYIKIDSFEEKTGKDFTEAVEELDNKNVKGFVLDLRDNGGGLVSSGIQVADLLLGEGKIVNYIDKNGTNASDDSDDFKTDLPYTVLVNENTASASEIVTAAVKDHKAAKIIGKKTYGKGVIQRIDKFKDGSGAKLTIMEYTSPDGNKINKKGIKPDIEVDFTDEDVEKGNDPQLEKAKKLLK